MQNPKRIEDSGSSLVVFPTMVETTAAHSRLVSPSFTHLLTDHSLRGLATVDHSLVRHDRQTQRRASVCRWWMVEPSLTDFRIYLHSTNSSAKSAAAAAVPSDAASASIFNVCGLTDCSCCSPIWWLSDECLYIMQQSVALYTWLNKADAMQTV